MGHTHNYHYYSKIYNAVMCPKDADGIANNVNPDTQKEITS